MAQRIRVPALNPHVAWSRLGREQVILRVGTRDKLITGPIYGDLLAAIGRVTTDQLIARLSASHEPQHVLFALHELQRAGYIEEQRAPGSRTEAADAYWSSLDLELSLARRRLAASSVAVLGLGVARRDCRAVESALRRAGIATADRGDLTLVLVNDYLDPGLADVERQARHHGREWLLTAASGSTVLVGPWFGGECSVCRACLAGRLREARWVDEVIRRRTTHSSRPAVQPRLATATAAAVAIIASTVARHLAGLALPGDAFTSFDLGSLESAEHHVRSLPDCAECAPALAQARRERQSAMLGVLRSGSEDFSRLAHLVSPLVGLVDRVRDFEAAGPVQPACIVTALQPTTAGFDGDAALVAPRDLAFGKGLRRAQAIIGCIGEAVERYSTMTAHGGVAAQGSLQSLGNAAIDPGALLEFSARQYEQRAALNAAHGGFNWIPEPFDPTQSIAWTAVRSLTTQTTRLVPSAYCFYDPGRDAGRRFMSADSNGCASGSSWPDACRRALLELIERDAAALWWYNRSARPAVDLGSFGNSAINGFIEWAHHAARVVCVIDITTDIDVPAFAALSARAADGGRIGLGFGCHAEAEQGILHALLEMYQMTQLFESGAASAAAAVRAEDARVRAVRRWLAEETLERQPFLRTEAVVRRDAYDRPSDAGRRDELGWLLERLAGVGLEAWALDLTRADIGIPVARVVAPGLRHFWARFAPGRLYDVPIRLGWLPAPRAESELNPIPLFL